MPVWVRVYDEDRDLWQYFASLEEVPRFRERSDIAAMGRYQQRYGALAGAPRSTCSAA